MDITRILTIVECIGMVSFSISATIASVQKKNDLVGTLLCALLTAFGGGIMRDLILGITPPNVFYNQAYHRQAVICVTVTLIFYSLCFNPKFYSFWIRNKNNFILYFTDAVGISIYCIYGVDTARLATDEKGGALILIFCGCITAVGGGMLRDISNAETPFIFRKHIYLLAVLAGTVFYVFTLNVLPMLASMLISIAITMTIRVLAIIFKWNLPVPGRDKKQP